MPPKATARKPKPVQPVAPVQPTLEPTAQMDANTSNREVVYDKLEITEYSTASKKGPLTIARMKKLMGWETEKEWQARMVAAAHAEGKTDAKPEHFLFGDGVPLEGGGVQPIHCLNLAKEKVICWNNAHNRAFDPDWSQAITHTVLYGQWAGPYTIPGETVNGETIRISRYGEVLSGQHQMTGAIMAGEWLAKARADGTDPPDDPKYPAWKTQGEPFLETIVITGMSSDPRVLMTVDYVKPRTAADVFYTSDTFKECTASQRQVLCKNLATAVDVLWTRTGAKGYKTHPEIVGFLERHRTLLKCVEHLSALNADSQAKGGRKISGLRLNPGQCAALMYLQATSATDAATSDEYRNDNPPTEKKLDWTLWDRAEDFWSLLAEDRSFIQVRIALNLLNKSDPDSEQNQGLGGRITERLALLCKAWDRWKEHSGKGAVFTDDDIAPGGDLDLAYTDVDDKGNKLPAGELKLLDTNDFLGIDCPPNMSEHSDPPIHYTPEEMEKATEALRARRAQESNGKK